MIKHSGSQIENGFAAAHDGFTQSHTGSAASESHDNHDRKVRKEEIPVERKSLKVRGTGMTNWWLLLSFCVLSLDCFHALIVLVVEYVLNIDFSISTCNVAIGKELEGLCAGIDYLTAFINLGKGTCCISALCVCFGYYTFCFLFGFYQSPCPQAQLLDRYKKKGGAIQWPEWASLELFFCLDFLVHVGIVVLQYYHWNTFAYSSIGAVICAFTYHRMWSFVYSEYKTVYFLHSELVYGWFSPLPPQVMIIVYSVEAVIMGYFIYHNF